jgi:glycosyltransferase involved in cell wall biosynthesis
MFDISVIIPFLNEEENIEHLISELNRYFSDIKNIHVEILFVDDGSTDNSVEKLQKLKHRSYKPRIISLSKNYGSHAAIRAGILYAAGKYTTFLPADLQDPLELVGRQYDECSKGYDIVFAVRNKVKTNIFGKMFSRLYAFLMKKYVSKKFPKKGFDIVMFNNKIKKELNNNIEIHSSIFLQLLLMGFKQKFITYDKGARKLGKSKWTLSKKIKLAIDSFVSFSFFPIRLVSFLGIFLALLGFGYALYIILRTIFYNDLAQGWPSIFSLLLIGFGVTNIALGIIAEYLWRTLEASKKQKAFIIDKVIDIKDKK